jgi:hypothetical protein
LSVAAGLGHLLLETQVQHQHLMDYLRRAVAAVAVL